METIRIEGVEKTSDFAEWDRRVAAWKKDVAARVNCPGWEGPEAGMSRAQEFVVVDGEVYVRLLEGPYKDVFFGAVGPIADRPDILCPCGNFHFELHYGLDELIARCPECGRKESVYSG